MDEKAERKALLDQEESEIVKKPLIRLDKKSSKREAQEVLTNQIPEFSASGIDAAMDLLDLTTSKNSKEDKLDRHPERRVKSAYAVFEERELPRLKEENPGLRLSQFKQMLQKAWKKSPENPLNQAHIAFDTSKDDVKILEQVRKEKALQEFRSDH